MLTTLDHLIVGVRDLDAAAEQTAALLGRPASWRGVHPGYGTANALFRVANTYLELLTPAGEGAIGVELEKRLAERDEGLVGMAFGTDDADQAAATLRAAGPTCNEASIVSSIPSGVPRSSIVTVPDMDGEIRSSPATGT